MVHMDKNNYNFFTHIQFIDSKLAALYSLAL